jgi:hypothetical protein
VPESLAWPIGPRSLILIITILCVNWQQIARMHPYVEALLVHKQGGLFQPLINKYILLVFSLTNKLILIINIVCEVYNRVVSGTLPHECRYGDTML